MNESNKERVLNDQIAEESGRARQKRPVKVLQFGEGNFLRAFVDWMIHEMNQQNLFNGNVSVIQPLENGMIDKLNEQDGLYTLLLRGIQDAKLTVKKEVVDVIERGVNVYRDFDAYLQEAENPDLRLIVSNTTEAGIVLKKDDRPDETPPVSFPAKLLILLRRRYECFKGDPEKGLLILPCELIDRNGDTLKKVLSDLSADWYAEDAAFQTWLTESNVFFNTLVDRIVSGYPREEVGVLCEEFGYIDNLIDAGEIFHFLVIAGPEKHKKDLPLEEAGLNVKWCDDITPYRTRKVRILNGAHTMTVLAAWLYGLETVKNCMDDEVLSAYVKKGVYEEIIPTLDLPLEELESYGKAVLERFSNPYIKHFLLSISLNSVSKFKTRVLPSLLEYIERKGELPQLLSFSMVALVLFYRGTAKGENSLQAERAVDGKGYAIQDSPEVLDFFLNLWEGQGDSPDYDAIMKAVLGRTDYWGQDLNEVDGLTDATAACLSDLLARGVPAVMKELVTD